MATGTNALASAIIGISVGDQTLSVQNYQIDHVVAAGGGSTTDGAAGIFLNISGTGANSTQAPYLDSLTSPVAGQMVRVLIVNNSPTILGRVVGLPNI